MSEGATVNQAAQDVASIGYRNLQTRGKTGEVNSSSIREEKKNWNLSKSAWKLRHSLMPSRLAVVSGVLDVQSVLCCRPRSLAREEPSLRMSIQACGPSLAYQGGANTFYLFIDPD